MRDSICRAYLLRTASEFRDHYESLHEKIALALASLAALTGSAVAADMAARPYAKAPAPMAPIYSWTGFYIFGGGGGGGLWSADNNAVSTGVTGSLGSYGPAGTALARDQRSGGMPSDV